MEKKDRDEEEKRINKLVQNVRRRFAEGMMDVLLVKEQEEMKIIGQKLCKIQTVISVPKPNMSINGIKNK